MISVVPQPSAVSRTICASQTCFCGLFRSATTAASFWRSAALNSNVTPARIRQTRTGAQQGESSTGLDCQVLSTRAFVASRLDAYWAQCAVLAERFLVLLHD